MYSGSIYKIYDNTNGNVYYGSTSERLLGKRLAHHRSNYKRWCDGKNRGCKSFDIIKNGDFDISLVEKVNYEEKVELHRRERWYIENNKCVNKNIPTRTDKEYKKKYNEEHKEVITEYNKKYKEEHKEDIVEKKKQYYEEHKEDTAEYNKKYREQNRDILNAKKREKYQQAKQAKELLDKGLGNS